MRDGRVPDVASLHPGYELRVPHNLNVSYTDG
jgi:hypothetical protein